MVDIDIDIRPRIAHKDAPRDDIGPEVVGGIYSGGGSRGLDSGSDALRQRASDCAVGPARSVNRGVGLVCGGYAICGPRRITSGSESVFAEPGGSNRVTRALTSFFFFAPFCASSWNDRSSCTSSPNALGSLTSSVPCERVGAWGTCSATHSHAELSSPRGFGYLTNVTRESAELFRARLAG